MTVRGQVNLEYELGTHKFVRPTVVVQGLRHDSITGSDTMSTEGMNLDYKNKKIILSPPKTQYLVHPKKTQTLKGKEEKMVTCIVRDFPGDLQGSDVMVVGSNSTEIEGVRR